MNAAGLQAVKDIVQTVSLLEAEYLSCASEDYLEPRDFCPKSIEEKIRGDFILCEWKRSHDAFKFVSVYVKKFLNITLGHETGIEVLKTV